MTGCLMMMVVWVLSFLRPVYVSTVRPQSKHIVVIVDHGASVTETQLQIAKDAAQVILSSIDEHDKVRFLQARSSFPCIFSSHPKWCFQPKDSSRFGSCLRGVARLELTLGTFLLQGKHLGICRLGKKVKSHWSKAKSCTWAIFKDSSISADISVVVNRKKNHAPNMTPSPSHIFSSSFHLWASLYVLWKWKLFILVQYWCELKHN